MAKRGTKVNKSDVVLGFHHLSKAHYGRATLASAKYVDEVMFGFYHPQGGTTGEMSMRWYNLNLSKNPSAKLECFSDAFAALAHFFDLLNVLACYQEITPEEFIKVLKQHGFIDLTKVKSSS